MFFFFMLFSIFTDFLRFEGFIYFFAMTDATSTDARNNCEALEAQLVSILSQEELVFVESNLYVHNEYTCIGLL